MQNFGVLIVLRVYSTQVDNGRCQEITAAGLKTSFEIDNSCVLMIVIEEENVNNCTLLPIPIRHDPNRHRTLLLCCPTNINLMFKDSAFGSAKATRFY
jgi:hypothetical protein